MSNYTKISDKMVEEFGLKVAYIYAKLHYRMNLSKKHHHKYYSHSHHSHYIIYKIKELARDCHMSRNSVIRALKKLEKAGYIAKFRTMYGNRIYLPKFGFATSQVTKRHHESTKMRLPREQRDNNKYIKTVSGSSVNVHTRAGSSKYPTFMKITKRYGSRLVDYATTICKTAKDCHSVSNPYHFIVGVLRRWHHKGIKTLNDAMLSEHDCRAHVNGPRIPIIRL